MNVIYLHAVRYAVVLIMFAASVSWPPPASMESVWKRIKGMLGMHTGDNPEGNCVRSQWFYQFSCVREQCFLLCCQGLCALGGCRRSRLRWSRAGGVCDGVVRGNLFFPDDKSANGNKGTAFPSLSKHYRDTSGGDQDGDQNSLQCREGKSFKAVFIPAASKDGS